MSRTVLPTLLVWFLLASSGPSTVGQPPVNLIFDLHVDPLSQGVPLTQKVAVYDRQLANATWVLDRVGPFGVEPPSRFLPTGVVLPSLAAPGTAGPPGVFSAACETCALSPSSSAQPRPSPFPATS